MLRKYLYFVCKIVLFFCVYTNASATDLSKEKKIYQDYKFPVVKDSNPTQKACRSDSIRCMIDGKTLGVFEGMMQEHYMETHFDSPNINLYNDVADGVLSILHKKVDFFIMHEALLNELKQQHPSLISMFEGFNYFDIAFGINKNNRQLTQEIDDFLKAFNKNDTISKINSKWIRNFDTAKIPDIDLSSNKKLLRVGTSATSMPYTFVSEGKVQGIDIEILTEFCKYAGYRMEILQMPFGSLLLSLKANKIDVFANCLFVTGDKKQVIDYTLPYSRQNFAFVYNRDRLNAANDKLGIIESSKQSFYNNLIKEDRYKQILDGLCRTSLISVSSIFLGTILGIIICFMNMHNSHLLKVLASSYISLIRGTPILVLLMINFYVVFTQMPISSTIIAIITFAMNLGAYCSEMFRSSILSIDKGQKEAGLAMGFTNIQTFIFIIAPQVVKIVLPIFKGECISLIKMTSIVGYVAVQDLTKVSDIIRSRTFDAFFPLLVSAILYFLLAFIFSKLLDVLCSLRFNKYI